MTKYFIYKKIIVALLSGPLIGSWTATTIYLHNNLVPIKEDMISTLKLKLSNPTNPNEIKEGTKLTFIATLSKIGPVKEEIIEYHFYHNGVLKQKSHDAQFNLTATSTGSAQSVQVEAHYKNQALKSNKIIFKVKSDTTDPIVPEEPTPQEQGNGDIDNLPSPHLPTPAGYKSWKGLLTRPSLDPISSNAMNDKLRKLTFTDMEKEFVYHARFLMYQSFRNNFSEINYYSKQVGQNYECVAFGIVKESVNNLNFLPQIVGTSERGKYSLTKGQKVKITLTPRRNEGDYFQMSLVEGNFSFAPDSDLIDSTTRPQYLSNLPGYSCLIEFDGSRYKSWSYNMLRTYIFSIGRSKYLG